MTRKPRPTRKNQVPIALRCRGSATDWLAPDRPGESPGTRRLVPSAVLNLKEGRFRADMDDGDESEDWIDLRRDSLGEFRGTWKFGDESGSASLRLTQMGTRVGERVTLEGHWTGEDEGQWHFELVIEKVVTDEPA